MRLPIILHPSISSTLKRNLDISVGHASSSGHSSEGGGGGGYEGSGLGGSESSGGAGESTAGSHAESASTTDPLGEEHVTYAYGSGGGRTVKVNSGPFNGSLLGGGTRSEIYGTSVYGSGYPKGYQSNDLPYYYFPLIWGAGATSISYPLYLNRTSEYGQPANTSRPGGPLMQATLKSYNKNNSVLHLIADNSTAYTLLPIIRSNCSIYEVINTNTSSSTPYAYTGGSASDPLPADAVQYYRASSAVLTLEGYNNSVVLSSAPNATAKPLPANVDWTLLACLNATIGAAIPLVDAPVSKARFSGLAIFGIVLASLIGFVFCCMPCCLGCCLGCFVFGRDERRRRRSSAVPSQKAPEDQRTDDALVRYRTEQRNRVQRSVVMKPAPAAVQEKEALKTHTVTVSELIDTSPGSRLWDASRTQLAHGSGGYAMVEGCVRGARGSA